MNDYRRLYREATREILSMFDKKGFRVFDLDSDLAFISFRIKECPHWRFGVWWYVDEEHPLIKGWFFTQHDYNCDKFKPSRSTFVREFHLDTTKGKTHLKNNDDFYFYYIDKMVGFISKHPYLAWYRDAHWSPTECIYSQVSRLGAFVDYWKDRFEHFRQAKLSRSYRRKYLRLCNKHLVSLFDDAFMFDNGDDVSPRFELVVLKSKESGLSSYETGWYSIFETKDEWKEFDAKAKKLQDKYSKVWSLDHCGRGMYLVDKKRYDRLKRINSIPYKDRNGRDCVFI